MSRIPLRQCSNTAVLQKKPMKKAEYDVKDAMKISLSLKAPKNWKIELTTCASAPSVTIPQILLQDAAGKVIFKAPARASARSQLHTNKGEPKQRTQTNTNERTNKPNKTCYIEPNKSQRRGQIHLICSENKLKSMEERAIGERRKVISKHYEHSPIAKLQNKSRSRPKGDLTQGLTNFPCGPCEESIALLHAASAGRNDSVPQKEARDMGTSRRERAVSGRRPGTAMGSNVSRHSAKGLDGRRSQSSGNLCHGAKLLAPSVGRLFSPCGGGGGGVSQRDRYKFCGSLPNHLDEKDVRRGDGTPESVYSGNNNYGEVYGPSVGVELVLSKLGPDLTAGDQGYSSEKSPDRSPNQECVPPIQLDGYIWHPDAMIMDYPFITKDNVFSVTVEKGSRGLGLSVSGGADSDEPHAGLLRIKRLFPHQPAWECGELRPGDILLEAAGTSLIGLTNCEGLEVLRRTPHSVRLVVCRPPQSEVPAPLGDSQPPPIPRRDPAISSSHRLDLSSTLNLPQEPFGEFDITLNKINGSLGFTLRKADDSALGHYVRALVREPAISDGRIRPGDKILAVNGLDISPLTHEEAVQLLRKCNQSVVLRLYRDSAQTPVSALSPTDLTPPPVRPALRQEAVDMLCDLAVRRLSSGESTSPRRRRLERHDQSRTSDVSAKVPFESSRASRPAFLDLDQESSHRHRFHLVSLTDEPSSLPPLNSPSAFSSHNPIYQSVHSPCPPSAPPLSDQESIDQSFTDEGSHGLLKWKGVVFTNEDEVDDAKDVTPINETNQPEGIQEDGEILTVELSKGWNSRLGFSLQKCKSGTCISAVYADSVAAKDGRLHAGDKILMINDESTEGLPTSQVIDLLRKIRGAIAITVFRPAKAS